MEFYQFLSRILLKIGVKFRGVFGTGDVIKKEAKIDENSLILDVFGSSRGVSGRLGASRDASGLALPCLASPCLALPCLALPGLARGGVR